MMNVKSQLIDNEIHRWLLMINYYWLVILLLSTHMSTDPDGEVLIVRCDSLSAGHAVDVWEQVICCSVFYRELFLILSYLQWNGKQECEVCTHTAERLSVSQNENDRHDISTSLSFPLWHAHIYAYSMNAQDTSEESYITDSESDSSLLRNVDHSH